MQLVTCSNSTKTVSSRAPSCVGPTSVRGSVGIVNVCTPSWPAASQCGGMLAKQPGVSLEHQITWRSTGSQPESEVEGKTEV